MSIITKLKNDYKWMYNNILIKQKLYPELAYISNRIIKNKDRYQITPLIPYYVVGCIHYRESMFNFNRHLHNGDPLTNRTVNVPKGRPEKGNPPFTWEESALDALMLKKQFIPKNGLKNIIDILIFCEAYNGFGYAYKNIYSPYLWNGSQYYDKGKYVKDGFFDINAIDKQLGIACIIYYMNLHNLI